MQVWLRVGLFGTSAVGLYANDSPTSGSLPEAAAKSQALSGAPLFAVMPLVSIEHSEHNYYLLAQQYNSNCCPSCVLFLLQTASGHVV